jgi:hypothetical protein
MTAANCWVNLLSKSFGFMARCLRMVWPIVANNQRLEFQVARFGFQDWTDRQCEAVKHREDNRGTDIANIRYYQKRP